MIRRLLYLTIITAIICSACTNRKPNYVIGVSQCTEDIWRDWQNSEMILESMLHDGVELRFKAARDDSKRQIEQIDSLVESGIQLLIVAPNQLASVTPAINRAYDKGIPVIVFERKTDSPKYTAFVSADNYEIGRMMGEYVEMRLKGKGRVLEILGLKGSSPAEERHKGFIDALKGSEIEIVASLQSDWTEEKGYETVKNYKGNLEDIDLVFAHNDRSALGARRAFIEAKIIPLPLFCGIDGLPGQYGGIQMRQRADAGERHGGAPVTASDPSEEYDRYLHAATRYPQGHLHPGCRANLPVAPDDRRYLLPFPANRPPE